MTFESERTESKEEKTNPRGFKLMTIIDCLAWDLLQILRHALTNKHLDCDHLKLHILMTMSDVSFANRNINDGKGKQLHVPYRSNAYVNNLLFRDYGAANEEIWHTFHLPKTENDGARTVKIHDEAINYLSYVLERKLTLAQNLKDRPTNLHLLFAAFSQFSSLHSDWKLIMISRDRSSQSTHEDKSYFRHTANNLAIQLQNLGSSFGEISHRRRQQYGPIWLVVGECVTEVAEELSLFEVFEALPLSLNEEFIDNAGVQKRFIRVIDSLNERYKLLRSCGLKPETWIERNTPSIAVLRELKKLRTDAEQFLITGLCLDKLQAYRCAFNENKLKKQRKKYANVMSFDEFTETEYGMTMINYSDLSLDQMMAEGLAEENYALYDTLPGDYLDDSLTQSVFDQFDEDNHWVQYLIDSRPELFNDVMIVFFQEAIGSNRYLTDGLDDRALLSDPKFQKLIQADSQFCDLADDELALQLIHHAEKIITQGIAATRQEQSFSKLSLVQAHE